MIELCHKYWISMLLRMYLLADFHTASRRRWTGAGNLPAAAVGGGLSGNHAGAVDHGGSGASGGERPHDADSPTPANVRVPPAAWGFRRTVFGRPCLTQPPPDRAKPRISPPPLPSPTPNTRRSTVARPLKREDRLIKECNYRLKPTTSS